MIIDSLVIFAVGILVGTIVSAIFDGFKEAAFQFQMREEIIRAIESGDLKEEKEEE